MSEASSFGGIIVSTMTPERSLDIYFQYITDAEGVKKAVEELRRTSQLGFDTETTELDPYKGKLRLVQLSTGRDTFVFDIKRFADQRENPSFNSAA